MEFKKTNVNSLEMLEESLLKGFPVIIGVETYMGTSESSVGHWMLLVGLDDKKVYVRDPGRTSESDGRTSYTHAQFISAWATQGYAAIFFQDSHKVGEFSDGWHDHGRFGTSSPVPSQPFVDSFLNNTGYVKECWEMPDSYVTNISFFNNVLNAQDNIYKQDFGNVSLVLNQRVYNSALNVIGIAFPIHGQIKIFWLQNIGDYGPPISNEYAETINGINYIIQWFEPSENNFVYIAYNTQTGAFNDLQMCLDYGKYLDQSMELNIGYKSFGYGMGGGAPMVTDPANLTCNPISTTEMELIMSLPDNSAEYNQTAVYVDGILYDTFNSVREKQIISGLSASTNYCVNVKLLNSDNDTKSELSNESCATTMSANTTYSIEVTDAVLSSAIDGDNNPTNSKSSYARSDDIVYFTGIVHTNDSDLGFKCVWVQPGNTSLTGVSQYRSIVYNDTLNQFKIMYGLSASSLTNQFGKCKFRLYTTKLVDGSYEVLDQLIDEETFIITPGQPYTPLQNGDAGSNQILLKGTFSSIILDEVLIIRDNDEIARLKSSDFETVVWYYTDTNLTPDTTYKYRTVEYDAETGYYSPPSDIRSISTTEEIQLNPVIPPSQ